MTGIFFECESISEVSSPSQQAGVDPPSHAQAASNAPRPAASNAPDLPFPSGPCPACLSPVFWLDAYGNLRCQSCRPPRTSTAIRSRWCVAVDSSTSPPREVWEPFPAPSRSPGASPDDDSGICNYFDHMTPDALAFLSRPRNPSPCLWCGGRSIHSAACDRLHDSWSIPCPFRKHKGKLISAVAVKDPEYLRGLLRLMPFMAGDIKEEFQRCLSRVAR